MPLGTKMSAYRDFCLMVNKAFRECDTELLSKSIRKSHSWISVGWTSW